MLLRTPVDQRRNARHFPSSENAQSSSAMPAGGEVSLRRSPLATDTSDRPDVSSAIAIAPPLAKFYDLLNDSQKAKFNALGTNIARVADQSRGNSLERRIQAAEQQGAMTAAFAATGTGGASQRMLKTTLALTAARKETRIEGQEKQ